MTTTTVINKYFGESDGRSIEAVVQISDFHAGGFRQEDHEALTKTHGRILEAIRALDEVQRGVAILVATGDIFDTKEQVSYAAVDMARQFFTELASILPTYVMAGNHDLNRTNPRSRSAVDIVLSGIFGLVILNGTGVHQVCSNASFNLLDAKDLHGVDYTKYDPDLEFPDASAFASEDHFVLGLFHGAVGSSPAGSKCKNYVPAGWFANKGCRAVACGDWHLRQVIFPEKRVLLASDPPLALGTTAAPTIAYAGSPVQMTFGETYDEHGFLVWNLKEGVRAVNVRSDVGRLKLRWNSEAQRWDGVNMAGGAPVPLQQLMPLPLNFHYATEGETQVRENALQEMLLPLVGGRLVGKTLPPTPETVSSGRSDASTRDAQLAGFKPGAWAAAVCAKDASLDSGTVASYLESPQTLLPLFGDSPPLKLKEDIAKYETWFSGACGTSRLTFDLKSLRWSNLAAYGPGNVLELPGEGELLKFCALNGYGKSSLVAVHTLSLFGDSSVRSVHSKACPRVGWSLVTFVLGDATYSLERTFKSGKGLSFDETAVVTRLGSPDEVVASFHRKDTVDAVEQWWLNTLGMREMAMAEYHDDGGKNRKSTTKPQKGKLMRFVVEAFRRAFVLTSGEVSFLKMDAKSQVRMLARFSGLEAMERVRALLDRTCTELAIARKGKKDALKGEGEPSAAEAAFPSLEDARQSLRVLWDRANELDGALRACERRLGGFPSETELSLAADACDGALPDGFVLETAKARVTELEIALSGCAETPPFVLSASERATLQMEKADVDSLKDSLHALKSDLRLATLDAGGEEGRMGLKDAEAAVARLPETLLTREEVADRRARLEAQIAPLVQDGVVAAGDEEVWSDAVDGARVRELRARLQRVTVNETGAEQVLERRAHVPAAEEVSKAQETLDLHAALEEDARRAEELQADVTRTATRLERSAFNPDCDACQQNQGPARSELAEKRARLESLEEERAAKRRKLCSRDAFSAAEVIARLHSAPSDAAVLEAKEILELAALLRREQRVHLRSWRAELEALETAAARLRADDSLLVHSLERQVEETAKELALQETRRKAERLVAWEDEEDGRQSMRSELAALRSAVTLGEALERNKRREERRVAVSQLDALEAEKSKLEGEIRAAEDRLEAISAAEDRKKRRETLAQEIDAFALSEKTVDAILKPFNELYLTAFRKVIVPGLVEDVNAHLRCLCSHDVLELVGATETHGTGTSQTVNSVEWKFRVVGDDDEARGLEYASGFQTAALELAMRFALARQNMAPVICQTVVLDEPFTVADAENLARCGEFLAAASKLFSNVLLITHQRALCDATPGVAVPIERRNGTSRLCWPVAN
jgi:DNA repair exonuclease SbcCD nuclease subunit